MTAGLISPDVKKNSLQSSKCCRLDLMKILKPRNRGFQRASFLTLCLFPLMSNDFSSDFSFDFCLGESNERVVLLSQHFQLRLDSLRKPLSLDIKDKELNDSLRSSSMLPGQSTAKFLRLIASTIAYGFKGRISICQTTLSGIGRTQPSH